MSTVREALIHLQAHAIARGDIARITTAGERSISVLACRSSGADTGHSTAREAALISVSADDTITDKAKVALTGERGRGIGTDRLRVAVMKLGSAFVCGNAGLSLEDIALVAGTCKGPKEIATSSIRLASRGDAATALINVTADGARTREASSALTAERANGIGTDSLGITVMQLRRTFVNVCTIHSIASEASSAVAKK